MPIKIHFDKPGLIFYESAEGSFTLEEFLHKTGRMDKQLPDRVHILIFADCTGADFNNISTSDLRRMKNTSNWIISNHNGTAQMAIFVQQGEKFALARQ